ncbi:hypothetical protein TELCIR_01599 [Teladorsagia circumcincta]|uniref:Uncharacterized protein n=1 Tax=Teladorsagia circumcincta TaxID=45464 RepID=A0A2G9V1S3_TELCI|nr:hypothetical protein TELCIR_01599 [Teladorsagia circumcincta]
MKEQHNDSTLIMLWWSSPLRATPSQNSTKSPTKKSKSHPTKSSTKRSKPRSAKSPRNASKIHAGKSSTKTPRTTSTTSPEVSEEGQKSIFIGFSIPDVLHMCPPISIIISDGRSDECIFDAKAIRLWLKTPPQHKSHDKDHHHHNKHKKQKKQTTITPKDKSKSLDKDEKGKANDMKVLELDKKSSSVSNETRVERREKDSRLNYNHKEDHRHSKLRKRKKEHKAQSLPARSDVPKKEFTFNLHTAEREEKSPKTNLESLRYEDADPLTKMSVQQNWFKSQSKVKADEEAAECDSPAGKIRNSLIIRIWGHIRSRCHLLDTGGSDDEKYSQCSGASRRPSRLSRKFFEDVYNKHDDFILSTDHVD